MGVAYCCILTSITEICMFTRTNKLLAGAIVGWAGMMTGSAYCLISLAEVHGWMTGSFIIVGGAISALWYIHCIAQLYPDQQTTPDLVGMFGFDTE